MERCICFSPMYRNALADNPLMGRTLFCSVFSEWNVFSLNLTWWSVEHIFTSRGNLSMPIAHVKISVKSESWQKTRPAACWILTLAKFSWKLTLPLEWNYKLSPRNKSWVCFQRYELKLCSIQSSFNIQHIFFRSNNQIAVPWLQFIYIFQEINLGHRL